eukprot:scaffold31602_cov19-Tisochrysis_lutea.AAC.5
MFPMPRLSNHRGGLPIRQPLSTVAVKAVVPRVEQVGVNACRSVLRPHKQPCYAAPSDRAQAWAHPCACARARACVCVCLCVCPFLLPASLLLAVTAGLSAGHTGANVQAHTAGCTATG